MKIVYACVHINRLAELRKNIRYHAPFVDRMIVSDGGSTDGSLEWLRSEEAKRLNVEVVVKKQERLQYGNHTPDARNPYLRALNIGTDNWLLVMDTDEFLEEDACKKLRHFAQKAEENGFDEVRFQAHDIWTYENDEIYDSLSNYWKENMFVKIYPGMEYMGHTHSGIWRPGAANKMAKAKVAAGGGEFRYLQYRHEKTERMMWRNSTFLYWTTCMNAGNKTDNPVWLDFHKMMDKYGHKDWHLFNRAMEQGNLPKEITDWFVAHKEDENPEAQAYWIYYFLWLHPEENTQKLNCERHSRYTWDYVLKCKNV